MQCDVCGLSNDGVAEYKSTLSDKKVCYCRDCLFYGREPYEDLVFFGWEFNMFNKKYQQKIIMPTLAFNNKTVQQFNEDVIKKRYELNVSTLS